MAVLLSRVLRFPLFLTAFSACWCQPHISLNFHHAFCVHHSDHILTRADQVGDGPARTRPKSHRLRYVASHAYSPLGPSLSLPQIWWFSKTCLQALSLSFSLLPPLLLLVSVPTRMIPGSVAGLCPPPSLFLASWSGSLEFCCLDFKTSISKSWCFLLPREYSAVQPKGVFWGQPFS